MVSTQVEHGTPPAVGPAGEQPPGLEKSLGRHARGGPEGITRRLKEMDGDADGKRAGAPGDPRTGVALGVALGAVLGAALGPRLALLPAAAGAFLLVRALMGRPRASQAGGECGVERSALKALRGDFHGLLGLVTAEDRAEVARFEGEGGPAHRPEVADSHDRQDELAVAAALQAARR